MNSRRRSALSSSFLTRNENQMGHSQAENWFRKLSPKYPEDDDSSPWQLTGNKKPVYLTKRTMPGSWRGVADSVKLVINSCNFPVINETLWNLYGITFLVHAFKNTFGEKIPFKNIPVLMKTCSGAIQKQVTSLLWIFTLNWLSNFVLKLVKLTLNPYIYKSCFSFLVK